MNTSTFETVVLFIFSLNLFVAVVSGCISWAIIKTTKGNLNYMHITSEKKNNYQLWFRSLSVKAWYYCLHPLAETNIRFILNNTHYYYDLIIIFFNLRIKTCIASEVSNRQISIEKSANHHWIFVTHRKMKFSMLTVSSAGVFSDQIMLQHQIRW